MVAPQNNTSYIVNATIADKTLLVANLKSFLKDPSQDIEKFTHDDDRALTENEINLFKFIDALKIKFLTLWNDTEKEEFDSLFQTISYELDGYKFALENIENLGIPEGKVESAKWMRKTLVTDFTETPEQTFQKLVHECLKEANDEVAVGGTALNINIISSAISGANINAFTIIGDDDLGKELIDKLDKKDININFVDSRQKGSKSTESVILQDSSSPKRVYAKSNGVDMDRGFRLEKAEEFINKVKEDLKETPNNYHDFFMTLTLVGKTKEQEGLKYILDEMSQNPDVEFKTMASSNPKDVEKNRDYFKNLHKASNKIFGNDEEFAALLNVDKDDPEAIMKAVQEQLIQASPSEEKQTSYNARVEKFGSPSAFISCGTLGGFVVEEDKIFRVSIEGDIIDDPDFLYEKTDKEKAFFKAEEEAGIQSYFNGCGDNATGAFDGALKAGYSKEFAAKLAMAMAQECSKNPPAQAENPEKVLYELIQKEKKSNKLAGDDLAIAKDFKTLNPSKEPSTSRNAEMIAAMENGKEIIGYH